jgi:hypothetical protein
MYPRRAYQMVALDEYDSFRLLMTMVRPIGNGSSNNTQDIAYVVSNMKVTLQPALISAKPKILAEHLTTTPSTYSRLFDQSISDNPFAPCCTPSTLPSSHSVKPLEQAILLCCLFLGIGERAFVAIGSGKAPCSSPTDWT